jgi:toxin YoeB
MGKYLIEVSEEAKKHLVAHHKAGDKNTIKRIERIFEELSETPYSGFASPESIKGNLSGLWSRQINKKDRIVYQVLDEVVLVVVISTKGHYGDK